MFRDGGQRHAIWLRQCRHTLVPAREGLQDTPTRRVGESAEDIIEPGNIFNHMVKYQSKTKIWQVKKLKKFFVTKAPLPRPLSAFKWFASVKRCGQHPG